MSIFGSTLLWPHAIVWVCVSHKCPKLCVLDRRVCASLIFGDATTHPLQRLCESARPPVWFLTALRPFLSLPLCLLRINIWPTILPCVSLITREIAIVQNPPAFVFWTSQLTIFYLCHPSSSVLFWLIYRHSFHMKGSTVWLWSNK